MRDHVKRLRELTGAGVMECQRALEAAGGDLDRAVEVIHERGVSKAEAKRERKTGAGLLHSYVHLNRVGVLLELRCETDFVARSAPFGALAHALAMQIAAMAPGDVEGLLAQPYIRDESVSVGDLLRRTIAQVGENIKLERFVRYEL